MIYITPKKIGIFSAMIVLCVVVGGVAINDIDGSDAAGETYTVEYVVNDKTYSYSETDASVTLKGISDLEVTLEQGKSFTGWKYGNTDVTVAVGSVVTLKAGEAAKFTAILTDVTYTVTFTDGLKEVSKITGKYGAVLDAPADPVKEGFIFGGWAVGADSAKDLPATITADVTYTAVWNVVFKVTWIVDGTTIAVRDIADMKQPIDPVKDSFRFTGWTDANGIVFTPEYKFKADTVFTASFAADTYTVTFVCPDGKTFVTETVSHGDAAIKPAGPPSGCVGWDWNFTTPITSDITIMAVGATPDPGMSDI